MTAAVMSTSGGLSRVCEKLARQIEIKLSLKRGEGYCNVVEFIRRKLNIEYCVQAWSPTPRHGNWDLILKIEKVQRKFTCLINDIGTLTYGARLKSLKLTTLAERRIRGDLIETFKIVTGLVNYGQNMFRVSRSGCNLVSKGIKVSRARQDFFGERVI